MDELTGKSATLYYIIIPIILFIIFYLFSSLNFEKSELELDLTGRSTHFALICSVMMTASKGTRSITCRVPNRGGQLQILFRRKHVRIILPLSTRSLNDRREELTKLFVSVNPKINPLREGKAATRLETRFNGGPDDAASALAALFQKVFNVGPRRAVAFRILTRLRDFAVVHTAWEEQENGTLSALPVAFTSPETEKKYAEAQSSLRWLLALIFLGPIPFILAFYMRDLRTAAIVLLVTSATFTSYRIAQNHKTLSKLIPRLLWLTAPIGAGLALYKDDLHFLQIIPSVYCLLIGIWCLYAFLVGRPVVPDNTDHRFGNRLISAIALLCCVVGLAVNEHLRHNSSEELWVWYYAYFRLELLISFLLTSLPVIIYRERLEQEDLIRSGPGDAKPN